MEPIIEARGLVKRYGDTVALDGFDLVAPAGQVTALLGPNGSGKTTFVRTVATLLRPERGRLRVAGLDVARDAAAVRAVIGLAGQHAAVESAMTGRENLEMVARLYGQGRRQARQSAALMLERLDLTDAADRRVRGYSGGMRRRLDLGASLVGAPRLLLLDEPTTGLDPRSRAVLWDAVRDLVREGTEVLLTTQYLEEADHLADKVVIIDGGREVASGTPADLKRRVGGHVIEVRARAGDDLAAIAEALARPGGQQPQVDGPTRRVRVPVDDGAEALTAAVRAVEAVGARVDDIALRSPTLDEAFLALTGQSLGERDDAATDAAEPAA